MANQDLEGVMRREVDTSGPLIQQLTQAQIKAVIDPVDKVFNTRISRRDLGKVGLAFLAGGFAGAFSSCKEVYEDRIIFQSHRKGNSDIWSMNPIDGSDLVQLTDSSYDEMMPAGSPDGRKISYIQREIQEGKSIYRLFVMKHHDSSAKTPIYTSPYHAEWHSPAKWSPDSKKLVFANSVAYNDVHIFVINADGTGLKDLTPEGGLSREPDWSPDGTEIVYQSRGGGLSYTEELCKMNADGSGKTRLTTAANSEANTKECPDWNPGSQILFSYGHNIAKIDPSGANVITLLTHDAVYGSRQYQYASWSPTGKEIVYCLYQKDGNDYDIWKMNADGTGIKRLTMSFGDDIRPNWISIPKLG